MFKFKKFSIFLLFLGLILSISSCEPFTASIHAYLERYSAEVQKGNCFPDDGFPFQYDNDGNLCIPSDYESPDGYYSFKITFANPAERDTQLRLLQSDNEYHEIDSSSSNLKYIENPSEPSLCRLKFRNSFLAQVDSENAQRNLDFPLKIYDMTSSNFAVYPPVEITSDAFNLSFVVNTPPHILEENPHIGEYYTVSGVKNSILCFNLKRPSSYRYLYDDLTDSAGRCYIKINDVEYALNIDKDNDIFTFEDPAFSQDSSEYTGLIFPKKPDFEAKDFPVYFNAGKEVNTFNVVIKDIHGLEQSYTSTVLSTGKTKLNNATVKPEDDKITIIPNFNLLNPDDTDTGWTVSSVTVHYKLSYEEHWNTKDFSNSVQENIEFYIPGGETVLQYYQTCNYTDIDNSSTSTDTYTKDNILYVTNEDTDDAYMGGSSAHRTSLTKVRDFLKNKTGDWEISLQDGDYTAAEDDMTDDMESTNINTYLVFSGPSKVTIKAPSSTERATLNANGKGRLITTNTTELIIENINFTGGSVEASNGGAIKTSKNLSLKNCIIYHNKSTRNGNNTGHGGGIYISYGNLSLDSCHLYDNTATDGCGGALYMTGEAKKTLTVTDTTVGNLDKPNQADMGAGLYLNFPTKGSSITIKNSVIGSTETSNKYANKASGSGNNSYGGGGIYFNSTLELNPIQVIFENTTISRNRSQTHGGGIYCTKGFMLTEKNKSNAGLIIQENYATTCGGGIYLSGNSNINYATIKNNTTDKNNANSKGGGVFISEDNSYFNNGNPGLVNCYISGNTAYDGGGIYTQTTKLFTGITLNSDGTFTNGTTVTGNESYHTNNFHPTAGIYCEKTCSVSGFEITSNNGSGLYGNASLSVENLIVSGHTDDNHGFGIATNYLAQQGSETNLQLYIENSTTNTLNIHDNTWDIFFYAGHLSVPYNRTDFNRTQKLKPYTTVQENTILLAANTTKENTAKAVNYFNFDGSSYFLFDTGLLSDNPSDTSENYNIKTLEITKHVPVTSVYSLQTIIDELWNSASETNPGIIWFTDNFTGQQGTASMNVNSTTIYSPAIFKDSTSYSPKKFILFGNGKTYNANKKSTDNSWGSAIYAGKYNTIEIRDLTVCGGYCNPGITAYDKPYQGGGIFMQTNSRVILKKGSVIGKISNNNIPQSASYAANVANEGAGVYVSNDATLIMEAESCIRENWCASSTIHSSGGGSAIYIASRGTVYLNADGTKYAQILYNQSKQFGTIYCERNASLHVQGTEIAYNEAKYVPGIFLVGGSYFYNESTDNNKLKMHHNTYLHSAGNMHYGVNIHCENDIYINNFEKLFANMDLSNQIVSNEMSFIDFYMPEEFYIIGNSTKQNLYDGSFSFTSSSNFTLGAYVRPNNLGQRTYKKRFSSGDTVYLETEYINSNWTLVNDDDN